MNEKPWLFKGPMVLAIMGGLKTQTRRLDGLAVVNRKPSAWQYGGIGGYVSELNGQYEERFDNTETGDTLWVRCPYWPRQVRWVRETFWCAEEEPFGVGVRRLFYSADQDGGSVLRRGREWDGPPMAWGQHPSIHMPRWASRITLEVVSVRVERVQEISEADAVAEGIADARHLESYIPGQHVEEFRLLWDSINGPRGYGWDVNLWVWVVQFRKCGEGE